MPWLTDELEEERELPARRGGWESLSRDFAYFFLAVCLFGTMFWFTQQLNDYNDRLKYVEGRVQFHDEQARKLVK